MFINFKEGGKKRGREKHGCKKDTAIGCPLHAPWPGSGIEPETQIRALDWNQTQDPSVHGAGSALTLSNSGQGKLDHF